MSRRDKTIDGITFSLVDDPVNGGNCLIIRWPDQYAYILGQGITEDGLCPGSWDHIYEDEPFLLTWAHQLHQTACQHPHEQAQSP